MKRISLAVSLLVFSALVPNTALADGCYICKGGSSCKQCRYGKKDNLAARKACEERGCKVGGTTMCSQAANVKVCAMPEAPVKTASVDGPMCLPN